MANQIFGFIDFKMINKKDVMISINEFKIDNIYYVKLVLIIEYPVKSFQSSLNYFTTLIFWVWKSDFYNF